MVKRILPVYIFSLTALFILIQWLLPVQFESNDDPIMLLIASGKYSGQPDNHLVFINFLIGEMLALLYTWIPAFEWYTLLLAVCNIISIATLIKLTRSSSNSIGIKWLTAFLLICIFIHSSLVLQFTRTAFLLAIAGISTIRFSKNYILGITLFIIGSLIRLEAAYLTLLLSIPLITPVKLIPSFRLDYFQIKILFALVLLSGTLKFADYIHYESDPDWKSYAEFNRIRGKINDNPNVYQRNLTPPNGVMQADFDLLKLFTLNPASLNVEQLNEIHNKASKTPTKTKLSFAISTAHQYIQFFALLLILAIISFIYSKQNRLTILGLIAIFGLAIGYIALNASVKERIFFPALFCSAIYVLFLTQPPKGRLALVSIKILIVLLSSTSLLKSINKIQYRINSKDLASRQFEMINNYLEPNRRIIPFKSSYRVEYFNAFEISKRFPSSQILYSGWLAKIPLNTGKLDSFESLIEGNGLLVDSANMEEATILIANSIRHNHNVEVIPQVVRSGDGLRIVEFKRKTVTPDLRVSIE